MSKIGNEIRDCFLGFFIMIGILFFIVFPKMHPKMWAIGVVAVSCGMVLLLGAFSLFNSFQRLDEKKKEKFWLFVGILILIAFYFAIKNY